MTAAPSSVALFGTFDVENYGDLLFPHLTRWLLGDAVSELTCYSPRGGQPAWSDAVPARSIFEAWDAPAPDLCLIGGGNIVHANATPLSAYGDLFSHEGLTYGSLWLGAAVLAARWQAKLAWNAPGVPHAIEGRWARDLRDRVLPASDYVSLRDEVSRVLLAAPRDAEIVPDIALRLSALWPAKSLAGIARDAFTKRGQAAPKRWVAFHFNDRYVANTRADCLDALAIAEGLKAQPVFLALGPCHGDDRLARRLAALSDAPVLVVDRPEGLQEIAALIAHSVAYVGSSMHGLITALSYRKPALAVARPRMVKFPGLLEPLGMAQRLTEGWHEAAQLTELLKPLSAADKAALKRAEEAIDAHGARLRGLLAARPDAQVAAGREALLRAVSDNDAYPEWMALSRELAPPRLAEDPGHEVMALALALRGRPHEALRRRIALARQQWPGYVKLKLVEVDWLIKIGDLAGARRFLTRMQKQYPSNPWHMVRMVRLLTLEGDMAAARRLCETDLIEASLPPAVRLELERLVMPEAAE